MIRLGSGKNSHSQQFSSSPVDVFVDDNVDVSVDIFVHMTDLWCCYLQQSRSLGSGFFDDYIVVNVDVSVFADDDVFADIDVDVFVDRTDLWCCYRKHYRCLSSRGWADAKEFDGTFRPEVSKLSCDDWCKRNVRAIEIEIRLISV